MSKEQSDPKKLRKKYIPSAEFYSQVIDSLQDYAIFTLDNEFIINSWNSGAATIFGYEPDEVIGEPFEIVFTEEDKKNGIPKKEIETALKEGKAVDNRWHLCKDGSIFYAYGLVFPLTGMEGELLGYVKIVRDLTERRKSDEAIKRYIKDLEELNTHKESILAILSHDLRSPLAAIIGISDLLKSDFDKMEPESVKRLLDSLYEASTKELSMLDYLVEWARIKYASEAFSPKKIVLKHYVEKVFENLNEVAGVNTINLHHDLKENAHVFADEKMLLSILQNIVSNAIRHSHPGGKITITAKRNENKMIVQVKDTGTGMSKQIQDKLFTPQMKVLSNTRKENKGAGIGLLLVKGFLEKNSGEIWVESVEGEGSSFYFTLPIKKPLDKIVSSDQIKFDENA
ncbi:MAG TPA: hypothetical protein DCL77_09995 [Prolixibacteraceae bacterium]|jgi:two-component system CheB/CheR fusion protein|nr:hypothetical protein [Prolixibacteraceae bacterium]